MIRTTDGGQTWQDSPLFNRDVTDIAVDPLNSQKIYVAAADVYTSTDQGVTFKKVDTVRMARVIAVTPDASGPIYVGTDFGTGIYKSSDGGASWVQKNEGLPLSGGGIPFIVSLAVDPSTPSRVWAGLRLGGGSQPGIVRSDDGGDHWYGRGLNRLRLRRLPSIRPTATPSSLAPTMGEDGYNIYKSTDGGLTWQLKYTDASAVTKIVFDPRDPCVAYAATEGSGVLRSINCGRVGTATAPESSTRFCTASPSGENPPLLVTRQYASGSGLVYPPTRRVMYLPLIVIR